MSWSMQEFSFEASKQLNDRRKCLVSNRKRAFRGDAEENGVCCVSTINANSLEKDVFLFSYKKYAIIPQGQPNEALDRIQYSKSNQHNL